MLCQGCAPIPTRTLTHFASPWRTKQFTDPVSDAGAQCWPDDEANERACSDCCGRSGGLRPSERGKRAARVTRGGRFKVSHYPQEERGGRRPRRTTESPRTDPEDAAPRRTSSSPSDDPPPGVPPCSMIEARLPALPSAGAGGVG